MKPSPSIALPEPAARGARADSAIVPDPLTQQCAVAGQRATGVALAFLAIAGFLYLSGILPSRRPLGLVAGAWHRGAAETAAALDAAPGLPPAAGWRDGHRLAEAALLVLQAPVVLWLLLLARAAARRRDGLAAGMALALLLVWLAAALGWRGPAAR